MRRLIPACFLALAAFLCVGRAKGSSIIYSIGCCGGSPWNLYQVSAADGASTYIGPIEGVQLVGTLAAAPNGTLFASGESFFFDPELLTINSATATATLVTLLTGLPNDVGAYSFAFSPNGTLFATYGGELFTIDVNSGDATLVGQTPGGSLAFSSDGTLYSSNGGDLYTVNQSTGAASLVTTLAFDSGFGETGSPNQMSLAFDPADGTLYTLAEWAGVEQSWLGTNRYCNGRSDAYRNHRFCGSRWSGNRGLP